jgi:hypothetical protein
VQVEEVETPRGKQKLYRVARGLALPSLALLEYLVFEADNWTRKHTAWLAGGCAPLGPETELTRLTGIMRRAYRVAIDGRGLATMTEGARLTRPGSYRPRREPGAAQPRLLSSQESASGSANPSASCGQPGSTPPAVLTQDRSASCGQPAAHPPTQQPDRSASCGQGAATRSNPLNQTAAQDNQTAPCGPEKQDTGNPSAPCGQEDSARCGVLAMPTYQEPEKPGRESAPGGGEAIRESAPSGVASRAIVNVESILVNDERNGNDNDAGQEPVALSAWGGQDPVPVDPEALVRWGVAALGDEGSLEWHRRCLTENGAERYRWAIEATRRAQAKGTVGKPGAYFTSLLRRRGGPPATLAAPLATPAMAPAILSPIIPAPAAPPFVAPVPPAAVEPSAVRIGLSEADCARTWQAALVHLRMIVPSDDYSRILRYAVLVELDRAAGWVLLGLPADYMREQVERRLAGPIAQALGQVCGTPVRVAAAVLPGQGRLAGAKPTLQEWLAGRAES